jgi:hypothetical protein
MVALQRRALPHAFLKQRQGWLAIAAAVAILVGAAAFQVSQLSSATVTSYEINELNRQRSAKQAENHQIAAEVAGYSSLARVDLDARLRLGLIPAERKLYVEVNQPLPERQTLPTRFLPVDVTAGVAPEEPIWRRLIRVLPLF